MSFPRPSEPLRLSPIGLGCVTFGREIDREAAFAMLDHAVERGVFFFDTAAAYGGGASETIVGEWLASRKRAPGAITIATKMLPPFSPDLIVTSVEQSLQRLKLPSLDLLMPHKWDATIELPETLRSLDTLVQSGKVRALGVSNFNAAQLARVLTLQAELGLAPFRVVENNHNVAVRDVDDGLRALCAAHGLQIITYSPLGAGFLTGKHRDGQAVAGTRFSIIPGHQTVYFHESSFRRLAQLEAIAARTGYSQTQLALAWALHQPGIASVLVGGRTVAHLDQAFAAQAINEPALFAELSAD